jgi:hypothetical protein
MRPSRITLGQLMSVVAVVALAFAVAPAPLAIAFSVLLLVTGCLSMAVNAPWFRIAAGAFACYPLLPLACLYATWWAAWYSLGHSPRPSLDDPKFIGPLVDSPYAATELLLDGCLPALLVNVVLVVIEFGRMLYSNHDRLGRLAARLGLPMVSWPLAFCWLRIDPGDVMNWFID